MTKGGHWSPEVASLRHLAQWRRQVEEVETGYGRPPWELAIFLAKRTRLESELAVLPAELSAPMRSEMEALDRRYIAATVEYDCVALKETSECQHSSMPGAWYWRRVPRKFDGDTGSAFYST